MADDIDLRIDRLELDGDDRFLVLERGQRNDVDLKSGETLWSDLLYEITGIDRDVAPGAEAFASRIHPDDRERAKAAFDDLRDLKAFLDEYGTPEKLKPGGWALAFSALAGGVHATRNRTHDLCIASFRVRTPNSDASRTSRSTH